MRPASNFHSTTPAAIAPTARAAASSGHSSRHPGPRRITRYNAIASPPNNKDAPNTPMWVKAANPQKQRTPAAFAGVGRLSHRWMKRRSRQSQSKPSEFFSKLPIMPNIGALSTTAAAAAKAIHAGAPAALPHRRTSNATGNATSAGRIESVSFTAKRMHESVSHPETHRTARASEACT